jgi:hypothetical protein
VNFGPILGQGEYQILEDAALLLKGQFPTTPQDKAAYLTKSGQVQSQLNNLHARVHYVWQMTYFEKEAHLGKLIEEEAFPKNDRFNLALHCDTDYRKTCETLETLGVVKLMIENFLWSIKILAQKV